MKPNPLTQHVTIRARFLKRVVRTYLGSDDFRWRMLVTTSRYTSHIAIIIVALIAVLLAGARLGGEAPTFEPEITLNGSTSGSGTQISAGGGRVYSPAELQNYLSVLNQDSGLLSRRAIAETSAPVETRGAIITYTVQAGDTIETIAARFKLLPSTLVWSNQEVEDQPDQLSIGQILYILPVDGIWYEVQSDDTLSDIADKYKVTSEDIVNYPLNNLSGGANLLAGAKIVIPNGVKAAAAAAVASSSSSSGGYASYGSSAAVNPAASGNFMWPTQGSLTQYFGVYHSGIDIAYAVGIPIAAADGGYVSYAGWDNTGYGYEVLINHGNGFTTRYAHLSQYYVDAGQPVARGQVIAAMGSTGNSTGPHLHFEVIYGGVPQNPLFYLP